MSATDSSANVDVQERDISNLVGQQHDALKHAGPDGKALPHTAAVRDDQVETHVAPAAGAPMPTNDEFQPKGSAAALPVSAASSASASSASQLGVDRESSNLARDIQAAKPADQTKQRSDMSIDLSKRDTAAAADAAADADADADKDKDKAGEKQSWTAAIGGAISSLLGTFSPRGNNNANADDVKQTDAAPTKQPADSAADRKEKRKSWTSIDDKNHPDYKSAASIPNKPEPLPNAPWADPKEFEREVKEHRHDVKTGIKELSPREQKADAADPAERWLEKNKPEAETDSAADRKDKRKSWTSIDDKNHPDYKLAASLPQQPEHLPNAPWADPKQFEREVKEHRHDDLSGIKELSPREQKPTAADPAERWLEKNKPEEASAASAAAERKDKRKSWTSIDDKNHPDYKLAASIPNKPEPLPNAPWADPKEFQREVQEHRHDVVKGIKELSPREQKADAADPAERWLEQNKPEAERDAAAASAAAADSAADRKEKRKSWTSIDDKNHPDYKLAASIPNKPEPLPNAPWADPKEFQREVKEHRHDDLKGIANLKPTQQDASKPDPSDKWLEKNSCASDAECAKGSCGNASCDKAPASASASASCDKSKAQAEQLKPSATAWSGSSNPILAASPSKQQQGAVDPSEAWLREEGGFAKTKPAAEPKQGKIDFKELDRELAKDAGDKGDANFADKWATAKPDSSIDQSALKMAQNDKRAGEVTRTPPMGLRSEASMAK